MRKSNKRFQQFDENSAGARRRFLKGAAAGVAGAAVGTAAMAGGADETTPLPEAPPADANYRETAHIRAYYRAARF